METAGLVILLFVLFIRWLFLRDRMNRLEQRIEEVAMGGPGAAQIGELTMRVWTLEQAIARMRMAPQVAEPEPVPPAPPPSEPEEEQSFIAPEHAGLEASGKPEGLPHVDVRERVRALVGNEEWEMWVGGSLLNKIGALVLVIAVALSLAYGFTHVTPAARAAMALAVSITLLGSGVWTERRAKYRIFARGLIGAGWAALYATSYAMWALPAARVIEEPFLGSLFMLAVAAGMIAHSLRYRAQAVTGVAYFTAFAALAMTPSTQFAVISLVPLAASLLYLAWRFEWYAMATGGLAATWLTLIARGDSGAPLAVSQTLFLTYWALFEAFDLLRAARRKTGGGVEAIFPVNALAFLTLSYFAWAHHAPEQLWLACAGAAALYLASALVRLAARPPASFGEADVLTRLAAGSFEGAFLLAATLAMLAIFAKVSGIWTSVALAAEAEVIYLAGVYWDLPFVRNWGSRAFAVSLARVAWQGLEHRGKTLVLGRELFDWTPPAVLHAAIFYFNRALIRPSLFFSYAAAAIIAIVLAAETPEKFIGTAWLLFAAVLFEAGARTKLDEFQLQAYAVAMLGAAASAVSDSKEALAAALAISYAAVWRTRETAAEVAGWTTALFGALLIWRTAPSAYLGLYWALWGQAFWLAAGRLPGAPKYPLTLIAWLATLVYDIDPPRLWISSATVAVLFVAQYLAARFRKSGLEEHAPLFFSILGTTLTAAVIYGRASGGLLTACLGAEGLALLAVGFIARTRVLRLEGLCLLFVCILKLFFYDLRNLETLYRILSFGVLGLIMLCVSWIYTRFRDKLRDYL